MNLDLHGKYAWVGGASRGIGRAIAYQLAEQGARLILVARNEPALQQLLEQVPGEGHRTIVVDYLDREKLLQKAQEVMVDHPIHLLINNTGGPAAGTLVDAPFEDLQKAFQLHIGAYQNLVQVLLPGMKAAGYGRIINIISTSVKQPIPGLGVSNTIRGAVANWAKTLSRELAAWGITVNNILPGKTQTERLSEIIEHQAEISGRSTEEVAENLRKQIPVGRFADPSEVAAAAGFLASPAAAFITGINLPVDGGEIKSL
ncbi:MAG: SDR family oxidoreductase [Bacteroidota bacterium]